MLTDRLGRKSTSKKKNQIKAWYKILGIEISNYEDSTVKLCRSQGKTNYTRQNESSVDSLASNSSYNWYLSI